VHNRLRLTARLIEAQAPRFTPAGVEAIDVVLAHESTQVQAASAQARSVKLELKAIAFDAVARQLARTALGAEIDAEGFLVNGQGRQAKQLMFQIERCETAQPSLASND
jgi:primosomal replication protein N